MKFSPSTNLKHLEVIIKNTSEGLVLKSDEEILGSVDISTILAKMT